jgi:hypothetical protein
MKKRLLVWFSKNADVLVKSDDLDQYVVLSEHGKGYFFELLGNFEYVWYCSTQLPGKDVDIREINFGVKVSEFLSMLDKVSEVEALQVAYSRCLSESIVMEGLGQELSPMVTLEIMYSSIVRALESVAEARTVSDGTREKMLSGVLGVLKRLERAQNLYVRLYGGAGYRVVYSREVLKCCECVRRLMGNRQVVCEEAATVADRLVRGWEEVPGVLIRVPKWVNLPAEAVKGRWNEHDWSDVPVVAELARNGAVGSNWEIDVRRIVGNIASLRETLAEQSPTFGCVRRLAGWIRGDCVTLEMAVGVQGSEVLRTWLREQIAFWGMVIETLDENKYGTESGWDEDSLADNKARCNNILETMRQVAVGLGIENTHHLERRWAV